MNMMHLFLILGIHGVWQPQAEALFDIRVIDTDAQSYQSHSPQAVLASAGAKRKHKYSIACFDRRASFTPLCFSIDDCWAVRLVCF